MRSLAIIFLLLTTQAWATSSIDTSQPAGTSYASAPIRDNFAAFSNDINAQQNCNRAATPPGGAQTGYCWLNVANPVLWCMETYNGTTWVPIYAIYPTTNTVSLPNVAGCMGFVDALGLYAGAPLAALGLYAGGALALYH